MGGNRSFYCQTLESTALVSMPTAAERVCVCSLRFRAQHARIKWEKREMVCVLRTEAARRRITRALPLLCCLLACLLAFAPRTASAAAQKGKQLSLFYIDSNNNRSPVELITPGSAVSVIKLNGVQLAVNNTQLDWETNAEGKQRIAVIYAPSKGRATLRLTEKPKSKVLTKCPAGKVVLVYDYGEKYTGVYYNGYGGYVQTGALKFIGDKISLGSATVSYEGSTTRTTNLRLRASPNQSGQSLTAVNPGMRATMVGAAANWVEVDINGWHGYIRIKFLTLDPGVDDPTVNSGASQTEEQSTESV